MTDVGAGDYGVDLVFAPDQAIHPQGHTHKQQQTIDHPYQQVPQDNEGLDNRPSPNSLPAPQERGIRQSVSTYERSPKRVLFSAVSLSGTVAAGDNPQDGPVKLVDSQPGRKCVIIKCPPGNTKGAYIGHNIDSLLTGFAWLVSPTDPPLYLYTEDAIWTIGISGQAVTDVIQAAVEFDPIES